MANPEHLAILQRALTEPDASSWNSWRAENPELTPDLSDADLHGLRFEAFDFRRSNLRKAYLPGCSFLIPLLTDADLTEAKLNTSTYWGGSFQNANLFNTNLRLAVLQSVNLDGANLASATLHRTVFADLDLSTTKGLESVSHDGSSEISISTLYRSGGNIPEVFLRSCGVPETMITFAKSLVGKPIQYYSAFISYSSADEHFARRLHNDLQMNGVRVWFAPEDLKIGETIEDSIDQAIRVYDKLILVLSQNSIERAWVKKEFSKAIAKEQQHGKTVLFPIRLDDSVFETSEQWAYDIRKQHIGDFRNWTNPLLYQNAINRLLRDLNAG